MHRVAKFHITMNEFISLYVRSFELCVRHMLYIICKHIQHWHALMKGVWH